MRNRLIHAYFDINLEILWQTVEHDLPPLISRDVTEIGHFGTGDFEMTIQSEKDFEVAKPFIQKAKRLVVKLKFNITST